MLASEMAAMAETSGPSCSLAAGRLRDYQESASFAAHAVRRQWQLPPGPVRNLTQAAESAGVYVFTFDMGDDVMGLSHWPSERPPVVCINSRAPGDRYRWTLAHEIGHLAIHTRECDPETLEREADEFAAELLMPRDDIYSSVRGLTVQRMRDLKHEWGVAMQALVNRAFELGLMSDYERTNHFISFSKRGWRTREPESLQPERTSLVPQLRRELASRFGNTEEFSRVLGFPEDVVVRLTSVTRGPAKGHLRLIPGGDPEAEAEQV